MLPKHSKVYLLAICYLLLTAPLMAQKWMPVGASDFRFPTLGGVNCDIKVDAQGRPFYAYQDGYNELVVSYYNGYEWTALDSPRVALSPTNISMQLDGNSNPIVAFVDGQLNVKVIRWDGSIWQSVGSSVSTSSSSHLALQINPSGNPVIAYLQNDILYVKAWTGSTWDVVGNTPVDTSYVDGLEMVIDNSGAPIVAYIRNSDSTTRVRKWNGLSWAAIGTGSLHTNDTYAISLAMESTGDLLLATSNYNTVLSKNVLTVDHWNGTNWSNIGTNAVCLTFATGKISMVLNQANDIYVGVDDAFEHMSALFMWDGSAWSKLGYQMFGITTLDIIAIDLIAPGTPIAVGMNQQQMAKLSVWDGNDWIEFDKEQAGPTGVSATSISTNSNGIPFLGYIIPSQSHSAKLKYWNGSKWSSIDSSVIGYTATNITHRISPSGNYYVGLHFSAAIGSVEVRTHNGINWNYLGGSQLNSSYCGAMSGMLLDNNGYPIIAHSELNPYQIFVKKWNGASWNIIGSPIPASASEVELAMDNQGNPVVAYNVAGFGIWVEKWNGSSWDTLGAGPATSEAYDLGMQLNAQGNPVIVAISSGYGELIVKAFDGSVWNSLISSTYVASSWNNNCSILLDNNDNPIVAYSSVADGGKIVARRYDGTGWVDVGSGPVSSSVAESPSLTKHGNQIFIAYTAPYVYVKSFIDVSTLAIFNVAGGGTYCTGDTGVHVQLDGSDLGVQYQLMNAGIAQGAPVSGTGGPISFGSQMAGTYSVIGTTSTDTVLMSGTVNIVENPLPTIAALSDTLYVCQGNSLTLNATGNALTYNWSNNVANNVPFTPAGNASYIVTATSDSGCVHTDTVNVVINPLPTITGLPADFSVCSGDSVTLNVSGNALSYNWSNSVVNNSPFVPADTTTYVVTAVSDSGCVATDTVTVFVVPTPSPPGSFTVSSSIVYAGQTGVYFEVPAFAGNYAWSITGTAATLLPNNNSLTMNIDPGAIPGVDTLEVIAISNSAPACSSSALALNISISDEVAWIGGSGNSWSVNSNWSGGFEPTATTKVRIPSGATAFPLIANGQKSVRSLTIESGASLEVGNGASLSVAENLNNAGVVDGMGYVVLNGLSPQSITGDGVISNLELKNSNGATIAVGDTIRIRQSFKPSEGTLTTNGGLELLADVNGTASILAPDLCNGNYIFGDVISNLFIEGGVRSNRLFGHPFTTSKGLYELTDDIDISGQGGSANGFTPTTTNDPSAFRFDSQLGMLDTSVSTGWIEFTNTDGVGNNEWRKLEGIRVLVRGAKGEGLDSQPYIPSDVSIDLAGAVNQCDVSHGLTGHSDPAKRGYNLIGNPYPSAIEMTSLVREDSIGDAFYVWDPRAGSPGTGAYVVGSFDPAVNASFVVPANAGMFLYLQPGSTSENEITFSESMKTQNNPSSTVFKTTAGMSADGLQLQVLSHNGDIYWDKIYIRFDSLSSNQIERVDAFKLFNPVVNFYSIVGNDRLSIDARPMILNSTIPLGFSTDSFFQYVIKVADFNVNGAQLYLIDKYLQHAEPLASNAEYQFTVTNDPLSQGDDRFEISIKDANNVANLSASSMHMDLVPNPASEWISIGFESKKNGNIQLLIRNSVGQQVYSENLGHVRRGKVTVPITPLAPGVYTVTLIGEGSVETRKFIKQ